MRRGLAAELTALLDDAGRRESIRDRFAKLHDDLALDANERAADALTRLVEAGRTNQ